MFPISKLYTKYVSNTYRQGAVFNEHVVPYTHWLVVLLVLDVAILLPVLIHLPEELHAGGIRSKFKIFVYNHYYF